MHKKISATAEIFLYRFTDYSGFALMILLALGIINVTLLLLSLTRKIHRFTDSPIHRLVNQIN